MSTSKCQFVHEVDDADFGYWNAEAWGESAKHEFACENDATWDVQVQEPVLGVDWMPTGQSCEMHYHACAQHVDVMAESGPWYEVLGKKEIR